jgi:hypothetical protein
MNILWIGFWAALWAAFTVVGLVAVALCAVCGRGLACDRAES